MVNERTFYKMSNLKNGISASKKDAEEREEHHPDRQFTTEILDSSVCRKILPWAMPQRSDATLRAADQLLSEQQKRRWNFDFLTETPLPGRYEWVRTDCSNGHHQKGTTTTSRSTIKNGEKKNKTSPYCRKSRPSEKQEQIRSSRSTRSCDRSLSGPRRSERNAQLQQLNKARTTV